MKLPFTFKETLTMAFVVGFFVNSLFIFYVFLQIFITGEMRAIEPTKWILYIELVLSIFFLVGSVVHGKKQLDIIIEEKMKK